MLADAGIEFIDLRALFVVGDRLKIADEGRALYYDKHHLSGSGARYVGKILQQELMMPK